jgi:hypothetical protein
VCACGCVGGNAAATSSLCLSVRLPARRRRMPRSLSNPPVLLVRGEGEKGRLNVEVRKLRVEPQDSAMTGGDLRDICTGACAAVCHAPAWCRVCPCRPRIALSPCAASGYFAPSRLHGHWLRSLRRGGCHGRSARCPCRRDGGDFTAWLQWRVPRVCVVEVGVGAGGAIATTPAAATDVCAYGLSVQVYVTTRM